MRVFLALAALSLAVALPKPPFHEGMIDHSQYYGYQEINSLMEGIEKAFGEEVLTKGRLNHKTSDGRNITFVKVTGGTMRNKKRIFIEAGIHGREWMGPAAAIYFLDRLVYLRKLDNDAIYLFNHFDWYIVPVANPDGYEYSRSPTGDKNWRKNRRYMTDPECPQPVHGVDLNRNFDADWSNAGASDDCHQETYHGTAPFSEAESAAIRDKVQEIRRTEGDIDAYISLSAYGQQLATPFAYTTDLPANHVKNTAITDVAAAAIKNETGALYTVGRASNPYKAAGTATDWAYLKENIQYSLAIALRPLIGDASGFHPPASEIVPTGTDVWAAINAIARQL